MLTNSTTGDVTNDIPVFNTESKIVGTFVYLHRWDKYQECT